MSTIEADRPAGFSPAEREAVLGVLEECADSLAVYQNTLGQPAIANAFPEIGYVERIAQ